MLQFRGIISTALCILFAFRSPSQPSQSLLTAIANNDSKQVILLLEKDKAIINVVDDDSDNVLMYAALYASADLMELLLKKGAPVDGRNKAGTTALMWCMHDKNKIELLLKYGSDINAIAKSGNTPLLIASIGTGQYDIIKLLLNKGADVLAKNKLNETVLTRAAMFGDTATISFLLGKGVDVNAKAINDDNAPSNKSALDNAIVNLNQVTALYLLDHGANPDADSLSALFNAVLFDEQDIVNVILKKTRFRNAANFSVGISPLIIAAYNEHDNTRMMQILIDHGADVNYKAPDGSTPLSWAIKKGNSKAVVLLRQAGAK